MTGTRENAPPQVRPVWTGPWPFKECGKMQSSGPATSSGLTDDCRGIIGRRVA
jgi:hypothetical protein